LGGRWLFWRDRLGVGSYEFYDQRNAPMNMNIHAMVALTVPLLTVPPSIDDYVIYTLR
jgi:hypothetical protein